MLAVEWAGESLEGGDIHGGAAFSGVWLAVAGSARAPISNCNKT
jgi:hypothetical protein